MGNLRGALMTLRPMVEARVKTLHADLQAPDRWPEVFVNKAPDFATLGERLVTRSIRFWEIVPEGCSAPVGYAGYRVKCGCPYLFFIFTTRKYDVDLVQDAIPLLVRHFFTFTYPRLPDFRQGDPLMVYLDRGVVDDMHDYLVESGFDPQEQWPFIDNVKKVAYSLSPETYEAYQSDAGEPELEPDAYLGDDYVPTGEYEKG